MYRGGHSGSLVGVGRDFFLVLLRGCKVGQGFAERGCAAAEVVIVHVYEEPAFGADPLSSVPVCVCFDRVEMSFAGYPEQFFWVWERTVADLCPMAPALAGVVVVVFHLSVSDTIVVVAGGPVESGMFVGAGLSSSGQRW